MARLNLANLIALGFMSFKTRTQPPPATAIVLDNSARSLIGTRQGLYVRGV